MPSIIFRYLFREVAKVWLIITSVLIFLALGVGLSDYVEDAAGGRIPVSIIAQMTGLSLVGNLDIVMPLSVLLAIMLVVGGLCRDNEMPALMAGGVGLGQFYRPFITLAVLTALFAGFMSLVVAPEAHKKVNQLGAETAANAVLAIKPERFIEFQKGKIVFYAGKRDSKEQLSDIFISYNDDSQPDELRTIVTADKAYQSHDKGKGVTLVLENGWRHDGIPGQANYRAIHFKEYGIQLSQAKPSERGDRDRSTLDLMKDDDLHAISKWQTRFSVPLSIIILALIALPIGRLPPRADRYGRMIVGVLFFVMYLNLVRLSEQAIQSGLIPPIIGEWWVHGIVLLIALWMIARENGWLRRQRKLRKSTDRA